MSKYIDIEWLKKKKRFDSKQQRHIVRMTDIYSAPSIDIVRCKECKYYDKFPTWSACTYWSGDPYEQASVNDDDFCSYGERKESE